jgi:hypothetical protein
MLPLSLRFSIDLNDVSADSLKRLAKERDKSRNALIREVLKGWLARWRQVEWPPEVTTFQGERVAPRFEQSRHHFST